IIEEMPNAKIAELKLIGLERVEVEGLKKQTAVKNVARFHVIAVTLDKIGPDRAKLNRHRHRLLVPQKIELHRVALELAVDHFGHLPARSFQLHVGVTRDWMIVDA